MARAAQSGREVEVEQARTETETLVANPEGTLTLRVASEPVRTKDAAGELVEIDTDLQAAGGDLVTEATPAEVVVSGDGVGELARVSDPETDVSVALGFEGQLGAPSVSGDVATYAHDEDTTVRVTSDQDGFAAHVLLAEPPASVVGAGESAQPEVPAQDDADTDSDATGADGEAGAGDAAVADSVAVYRFPLRSPGATARLVGGGLEFIDADGELVASSSALRMWDSQVDEFGDPANVAPVEAELVGPAGAQVLELRPSMAFLTAEDTVYPVTVDPDITLGPSVATYITNANRKAAFTTDYNLRVGSGDGVSQYRSFVNFQTESLAGQTVTDADLNLYQYAAGVCENRRIIARAASSTWQPDLGRNAAARSWTRRGSVFSQDSRFTTSASFNSSGPGGGSTPACGGVGWESIDVTGQVSSWAGMVTDRYGLYLMPPDGRETNPGFQKRFCSDDRNTTGSGRCQESDVKPELALTYTPYLGDQGWYSTSKHKLGERDTLKINHQSGNAYLAANDVQVTSLGMDLSLGRRYNSQAETTGQFGSKWTMSGGPDVWLEKIDQWRYVYHTPDGAELGPFVRKADTAGDDDYRKFFTPAGGLGADLKDNNDDTFTLTFHSSQKKYQFTQKGSDGDLFQTKQTDRSGNSMTYDYVAGTGRLSSITDTVGRRYQISYGTGAAADRITEIRDTNGPTTRTWGFDYDGDGRLVTYTDPEGDETTYGWVAASGTPGQVIETITYPVNDSGAAPQAMLSTQNAQTTKTVYAGVRPDGTGKDAEYVFEYHVKDNEDREPAECSSVDGTDRSARVKSLDPLAFTAYCFQDRENGDLTDDQNNMSTTVIDGKGDRRSASYSPDNQPEVMSDDAGAKTTNTYGDPGAELGDQLQNSTQPDDTSGSGPAQQGGSTNYDYATGASFPGHDYAPVSMVDANNDCTAYGYDPQGRLTDTWIGRTPGSNDRCDNAHGGTGGQHYQSRYNVDGTVDWIQDPNGNSGFRTTYTYDPNGQVATMTRPGGTCATGPARRLCTTYTYDGLSRTTSKTDGNGQTTRSSYDVMDRTTQSLANGATDCQPASGDCITYTYDALGNLTERTDQQGTTEMGYDPMNRRTSQNTPDGVQVAYSYDRNSRMTRLEQRLPGQATDTVTYDYDQAGQVSAVTDASGSIGIQHDSNQRLTLTTFPTTGRATSIDRTYTTAGKPKTIDVRSGTDTNDGMTDYTYGWNKNGTSTNQLQTLSVDNSAAAIRYDATFGYNDRGQLTTENRTNGGGPSLSYTYDNAGNLATTTKGGATTHYGYDRANQLCWTGPSDGVGVQDTCPNAAPGTSTVVARDAAGNSEGDPAHPIDYNPRNQATSVDGQTQDYYDQGNDLRLRAGDTALVNTTTGITARTTNTSTPDADTTYYTRMPDGRLLSMRGPDDTYYYVTDRQKSVVGLIDTNGDRAGTYRYDPYGKPTLIEGTTAEQANPFRWIGGYQHNTDQPGGYYKLGARFYNPTTGAFTQTDPEPGNMGEPLRLNAYLYSAGDPINNTDPDGRFFGAALAGAKYFGLVNATTGGTGAEFAGAAVSFITGAALTPVCAGAFVATPLATGFCAVAVAGVSTAAGAATREFVEGVQ